MQASKDLPRRLGAKQVCISDCPSPTTTCIYLKDRRSFMLFSKHNSTMESASQLMSLLPLWVFLLLTYSRITQQGIQSPNYTPHRATGVNVRKAGLKYKGCMHRQESPIELRKSSWVPLGTRCHPTPESLLDSARTVLGVRLSPGLAGAMLGHPALHPNLS